MTSIENIFDGAIEVIHERMIEHAVETITDSVADTILGIIPVAAGFASYKIAKKITNDDHVAKIYGVGALVTSGLVINISRVARFLREVK